MKPALSVVVPLYQVEEYVSDCLESLVGQQFADLEILVVDDGSTDKSRAIAEQWAGRDTRIHVLEQPHAGLSAARNTGVRAATGKYLAFCDSDDVVPGTAYAALVGSLETTGSDIASGDVRRVDSTGVRPYPGYRDVFAQAMQRTHIRGHTALVRDRMAWNKVFRRSFWDAHELTFSLPAYEDGPVMVRAHIEAQAVDVVPEVVYLWRIREAGAPSITQLWEQPDNVAACMRMALDTFDIIAELEPALIPPYTDDICRGNIPEALEVLRVHDAAALSSMLTLAREFVTRVSSAVLDALPMPNRLLMTTLAEGDLARLRQLLGVPDTVERLPPS